VSLKMGQFAENLRAIQDDFKTSWYFRLWGGLWTICAIMAFVALIVLAAKANDARMHKDFNFFISQQSSIDFPAIRLRLSRRSEANETFTGVPRCVHAGAFVQGTQTCTGDHAPNTCYVLATDGFSAVYSQDPDQTFQQSNIVCNFSTTSTTGQNTMVAFEIEDNDPLGRGSLHIPPGFNIWVNIRQVNYIVNGVYSTTFRRELQNHGAVPLPNSMFAVTFHIKDFFVDTYEQKDNYNGWQAVGSIGGFAFFLVLLHTVVMMIVGIFLDNNSSFLNGEAPTVNAL